MIHDERRGGGETNGVMEIPDAKRKATSPIGKVRVGKKGGVTGRETLEVIEQGWNV